MPDGRQPFSVENFQSAQVSRNGMAQDGAIVSKSLCSRCFSAFAGNLNSCTE
jgi:hypothetical protein